MEFILGEKIGMTQVFGEDGRVSPVTVIKTGPITITQVKTLKKDGYFAIQVGFGDRKKKNIKKPMAGHLKNLPPMKHLKESRVSVDEISKFNVGNNIDMSSFSKGDKVVVSAISKSKGFQGVVKRHGFRGGPRSHGQKHSEREPGSIGGGGRAGGRVVKGMRMAGRMGGDRVTVKNLKVAEIDKDGKYIMVKGAVPGRRGTLVEIRKQK